MRKVEYEVNGRKFLTMLPEGVDNVDLGVPIGPPEFTDFLNLPEPFATRLHNQFFNRKLFTLQDLQKRPQEIQAALMSAMRVDMSTIMRAYKEAEQETIPFE
jgi:hypothetical protein